MSAVLNDIVRFRGDRLFNGAVNLEWLYTDKERTRRAADAFVFHGPAYHGVSQADVGETHGHRLQDTARFTESVIKRCYGLEDRPFTLAIAGYGTGKSHLGLTLGALLREPHGEIADAVLQGIDSADADIGRKVRNVLTEANQPCLVVAVNGMQSFDLTSEVTRQIVAQIKDAGFDTRPLDDLRPRFAQAASLIKMALTNEQVVNELLEACDTTNVTDILTQLEQQDEQTYRAVHKILASININISALGGESVRDVIDVATREYCGAGKPFRSLIVLFDEFGRYTEFATVKSHVAGSGVLQDLFEGIQANTEKACFVGFIQFELNAYVQRVAPEHRNEILRYITRYQSASRVYLSINLETLIANLIEKKQSNVLDELFNKEEAIYESKDLIEKIARWFPQSLNHSLWSDQDKFHNVIRKGCWPLSAYSTWFLFYLAAGGKHLQERSALALLGDMFERCGHLSVSESSSTLLAPVDFWSDHLQQELITAEESGQQGAITHSYSSIESRHGTKFSDNLVRLLRAVVLASKLGLKASTIDDAVEAIAELSGLHARTANQGIQLLRDEYNVLEWDESFKSFDILGDAVPRTQFLSFVRQRVASTYDESGKAKLFASKAANWCDLLRDLECDFAEENKITTREWRYQAETSNLDFLLMHFKHATDRWKSALGVDEPRGTIIYCYVEQSRDVGVVEKDAKKFLKVEAQNAGVSSLPIWVVLLHDDDGGLGQALAELAVLEESLSAEDRAKYGNLVGAHKEKMQKNIRSRIEAMIKQRLYISTFKEPLESRRISRVGTEIFGRIYKSPIVFPFDGFTTVRGNAADNCMELTAELIQGRLDWSGVISKPVRIKNRAVSVLQESWGIFAKNGSVKTRPSNPTIRSLTEKWDNLLASGEQRILLKDAIMQLCAPPYGANIASAGLFMGVFIAPRTTKLSVIQNDKPVELTEWVQNDLFRGKFIDINSLHDVTITYSGDSSSEWENLLDDWEQAETYCSRRDWYIRSEELKQRVQLPSVHAYRQLHLVELSKTALLKLKKNEDKKEAAINKIDVGLERLDVSLLSWGTADLFDLIERMASEKPLWSNHDIDDIQPIAERSRQSLVHIFYEWLRRQTPKSGAPDAVGEFKHKMIHKVGGSLKKLKLDDLYDKIVEYTNDAVKKVELIASAHQLTTEIGLWLTTHEQATNFVRIAELRALHKVGSEYANSIRRIYTQIELPELVDLRLRLSNRLEEIKLALNETKRRASKLWQTKLNTINDAEVLQNEVDELFSVFEGCKEDVDDLQIMRRALRIYIQVHRQLENERLTPSEFSLLVDNLKSEVMNSIGEDEPPWEPEETIENFRERIEKNRYQKSLEWIDGLEKEIANMDALNMRDINRLHANAVNPPAILADTHRIKLEAINVTIEKYLNKLKLDWLYEKFKELTPEMQKQFLSRITS